MNRVRKKVFAAMSGGVDSSVAAALLKKHGYEVIGVHMRCYNLDGCADQDLEDARRAAETLGIPFYVFDFEKEYKERVVNYMVDGYRRGITPNPDVECNREIKFGLFLKKALSMGTDYIATGHYVRLATSDKRQGTSRKHSMSHVACRMSLFTARDLNKDQSYFLWTLTQEQLKHCLFPIGEYTKPQVRRMARKFGLPNAEKKDSQGICFLGKIALPDFLKQYIPARRGAVVTTDGRVVGEHDGAMLYTIGQRHGFLVNDKRHVTSDKGKQAPHYIAQKDVKTNTLVVAEGNDNPILYRKEIKLTNPNFIDPRVTSLIRANGSIDIFVRVRYRQLLAPATLNFADFTRKSAEKFPRRSASSSASVRVLFAKPQKTVAPGQSAVFYSKKGEMLGGGVIV